MRNYLKQTKPLISNKMDGVEYLVKKIRGVGEIMLPQRRAGDDEGRMARPALDRLAVSGPGHCFALFSDLRFLSCDCYMLPGGVQPHLHSSWLLRGPIPRAYLSQADWEHAPVLTNEERCWPLPEFPADQPWPIWTHTGRGTRFNPQHYKDRAFVVEGTRQFFATARRLLADRRPLARRARHLVAMPVLGTGAGGMRRHMGDVLKLVWAELERAAFVYGFDVAVVTNEESVYTALQSLRAVRLGIHIDSSWDSAVPAPPPPTSSPPAPQSSGGNCPRPRRPSPSAPPFLECSQFRELPNRLTGDAHRLARLAASGRLVVFVGAGASAGAGLPLWGQLLSQLADEAGVQPPDSLWLETLNFLDRARILELRLGGSRHLQEAVARLIRQASRYHSAAHAMLAALPCCEYITTNYDTLFEQASRSAQRPCASVPYEPVPTEPVTAFLDNDGFRRSLAGAAGAAAVPRWILKLHGCVEHPRDIVLTRADYLVYQDRRAALQGVVQALLITKHMLFIGFSLDDHNFHSIARSVAKALPPESSRHFGTAILLHRNLMMEQIWSDSLRFAPMARTSPPMADWRIIAQLKEQLAEAQQTIENLRQGLPEQQQDQEVEASPTKTEKEEEKYDLPDESDDSANSEKDGLELKSIAEAARLHDIFLDLLGLHASVLAGTRTHLLDRKFDGFLSPADKALRQHVEALLDVPAAAMSSPAFAHLESFAASLGLKNLRQHIVRQENAARRDSASSPPSSPSWPPPPPPPPPPVGSAAANSVVANATASSSATAAGRPPPDQPRSASTSPSPPPMPTTKWDNVRFLTRTVSSPPATLLAAAKSRHQKPHVPAPPPSTPPLKIHCSPPREGKKGDFDHNATNGPTISKKSKRKKKNNRIKKRK